MVRANIPSAAISCDQAATYQIFRRKMADPLIACTPCSLIVPSVWIAVVHAHHEPRIGVWPLALPLGLTATLRARAGRGFHCPYRAAYQQHASALAHGRTPAFLADHL
jgi:hypothetical protein